MESNRQDRRSSPLDEMLDRNRKELEQLLGRPPGGESSARPSRPDSTPPPKYTPRPSEAKPVAVPSPPANSPPPAKDARPAPDSKPTGDSGAARGGKIAGNADGIAFSVGLD